MPSSTGHSADKGDGIAAAPAKRKEPSKDREDAEAAAPEAREAHIEQLSREVASGNYQVDSAKVSSAIVEKHLDSKR